VTVSDTAGPPLTAEGRAFHRLDPLTAAAAQMHGALLIDIRSNSLRRQRGEVPGALVVAGPVRDWLVEPGDPLRVIEVGPTLEVIVIGDGGPASILAASALRRYGVEATDVAGGFNAWVSYELPVCPGGTPAGHYAGELTAPLAG
jgi:rhodanese-related sulfurtransferase